MFYAVFWSLWALAFVVGEGSALVTRRKGDTLSSEFRKVFRTSTKLGRAVWIVAFGVFAAWFAIHIATPSGWLF